MRSNGGTMKETVLAGLVLICGAIGSAQAQSPAGKPVTVTADNFNRAETDMYFGDFVKRGALGKFWHFRELPSIELDSVPPQS